MQPKNTDPIYEFYTNHPFPPPVYDLDRAREMWQDQNIHHAEHYLLWPHKEYRADVDVLIAGCGTSQAAKYALCHPSARVTAIDVSKTCLQYTFALTKKYELDDLKMRQLAIENVAELNQQFDLIICTGVLHHLADPDVGLRALRSVLKPDGAMYLMVYAPYGRAGVYMLQEYCRRLGIGTSEQELNDLISVLKGLPDFHPLLAAQSGSREFPNGAALADAVLNPRDVSYSVPQLFDYIERNDLRLTRFYWQAAYSPQCGWIARTPHAELLAKLPEREQYIEMELLRGMMSNHSIVVHRSDMNSGALEVSFDDECCLRYVPFRQPWTICVTERLPPEVAGALLNQTHLFPDLYLFIDAHEKQIYDAIDGSRSIEQIINAVGGSGPRPRDFFQKLWWYDQVVFDTSKANTASA
jgi:2-polyprenyl-3-methyl-5-hydroxy-6-metoxy-1,4-benzoquinol methylase